MARINKGILGPLSGTVGTVIGGSWKGISYIRSQPASRRQTSTVDQLDHQLKFSTVVNFTQTMTGLLQHTYKKYALKMSEYNAAFSYNYHNAVAGKAPDYSIDYEKALVSRGDLPNAPDVKATITNGVVHFTWTDNSGMAEALPDDAAILVVYCEAFKTTLYTLNGGTRADGAGTIDVSMYKGNTVQTWIGFISANGKNVANSIFTGELSLA